CRLFRDVFLEIGAEYPEIEKETAIVDAFTQWLITGPEHYDVCVTPIMLGVILTDLASVLQSGMGMAAGDISIDRHTMFEPIHGYAPKHDGKDKVNPMAMILAVREGLEWLAYAKERHRAGLLKAAESIELAVREILEAGRPLTYDLVGEKDAASCSDVG